MNQTENVIETNVRGVIDTLKSLNRPLTSHSFMPVGFNPDLQQALMTELRFVENTDIQIPMRPPPTFPEAPPPLPPRERCPPTL